ncbi:MAG: hypothetical protein JWR19_2778 [Pedosphaera sp.]|nr:hypothetical protein [Pedosphaera sp.]
MIRGKQVVVTVASGSHAEKLDDTFLSFTQNPALELHAFIVDYKLPDKRFPQITYHLVAPDPAFSHPLRDMYYRRWEFIDRLDAEYALVVDNGDVLCLQPMPDIPVLLRGAAVGACVEHEGGRYLAGQKYVSCYLNAGLTLWDVAASREMRAKIVERGRAKYRGVEDQLTMNEVIQTLYYEQLIILPCQYNYRPYIGLKKSNWPTLNELDGVVCYHNSYCIEHAKRLLPVKTHAELPPLEADANPLTMREQFWRRLQQRREPHFVDGSFFRDIFDFRNASLGRIYKTLFGKTLSKNPARPNES